ncbi:MAG: alpha/beta fold hydrolase [Aureisphaera sp.]
MPHLSSPYKANGLFRNTHFSTIYSAKLRPSPRIVQQRERLELSDGDFVDIDWSFSNEPANKVTILLHGLEGNAQRVYIKGHAKELIINGWDVAAMNHRGCSGEENRLYISYNSGRTDDLKSLIDHILALDRYNEIALVGFSLGGNLLLKYLGEETTIPKIVTKGVAVSAPLNLAGSLQALETKENWVYRTSFLQDLRAKYKRKMMSFPQEMTMDKLKQVRSLLDFDTIYTAPAHGFKDAWDYYEKCSSLPFLPDIKVPVLILNALNDSFLSKDCYPFSLSEKQKNIYLETPKHGGHVGFHVTNSTYYSEKRTLGFLNKI